MASFPLFPLLIFLMMITGCNNGSPSTVVAVQKAANPEAVSLPVETINPEGMTIATRFNPPIGYIRVPVQEDSFAAYILGLKLKDHGSPVLYFDGSDKFSQSHAAVVDMDIGNRDLQQCADAIMRIRAEYFFYRKEYEKIAFHFVNGFKADYSRWAKGERIGIRGNSAYWYASKPEDFSYKAFREYLTMVYSYAGTASLEKELMPVDYKDISIGDVYIRGGSPGHAMLVVDVAQNDSGQKAFMLAQSYMPAQSVHIVINPENPAVSPWYLMNEIETTLATPSWNFYLAELYRF